MALRWHRLYLKVSSCLAWRVGRRLRVSALIALLCFIILSLHVLVKGNGLMGALHSSLTNRISGNTRSFESSTLKKRLNITALDLTASMDNMLQDEIDDVVRRIYNLPLRYGMKNPPPLKEKANDNCAPYPSLFDLSFNNIYWQVLHSSNGTFYLYSAFYDNRTLALQKPSVRILGMIDRVKPTVNTYCQLWYKGGQGPVIIKVKEYRYIWTRHYGNYKNGLLQPYLLQCLIPPELRNLIPESVSLVEASCNKPTNNLKVIHNITPEGQKGNFAVCVKGLSVTKDISFRMAEWLELLLILGADKIFLYDLGVHPNVSKLLRHYISHGKVDLKNLTLPGEQPNVYGLVHLYLKEKLTHKRQNEVIPYNDCLYRNMNLYKFIVLLDIDEVIMPRISTSWKSLMETVAPEAMLDQVHKISSYVVQHVYFLDSMQEQYGWSEDVPRFMHMLQHLYRSINYTNPGSYVKCFHDPQRVLTLHNHFPFSCIHGDCSPINLSTDIVHLQHYRKNCVGELNKSCIYYKNHTVLDDAILRFKEPLMRQTLRTLRELGFPLQ